MLFSSRQCFLHRFTLRCLTLRYVKWSTHLKELHRKHISTEINETLLVTWPCRGGHSAANRNTDCYLLLCIVVQSGNSVSTFRKNFRLYQMTFCRSMLPLSSGQINESSGNFEKLVHFYQTTRRHIICIFTAVSGSNPTANAVQRRSS